MKKLILICVTVTFAIIISSCIDIERNIKINKDGSGIENQKLNLGKEFFDLMISMASAFDSAKTSSIRDSLYKDEGFAESTKEKFNNAEGVKLIKLDSRINPDSSKTIEVEYSFDNVNKMISELSPDQKEGGVVQKSSNEITYEESKGKINFRYKHVPEKDTSETSMSDEQKKSFAFLFVNRYMTFRIEFPYPVEKTNGEKLSENTVLWKFPIDKLYLNSDSLDLNATLLKK